MQNELKWPTLEASPAILSTFDLFGAAVFVDKSEYLTPESMLKQTMIFSKLQLTRYQRCHGELIISQYYTTIA